MRLADLQRELLLARRIGDGEVEVQGFAIDSRAVRAGDLFVALHEPEMADRHEFAADAARAGAAAVLVERQLDVDCPQLIVPDVAIAAGALAARFYDFPAERLRVIGVTGTKGKTTTSFLAHHALSRAGRRFGLLGTVVKRIGRREEPSHNTTLHGVDFQEALWEMASAGMEGVVTEVSSHALRLRRLSGARVAGAAFTNLGHDHLNFHQDAADYAHAKSLLFAHLGLGGGGRGRAYGVVNRDDPYAQLMLSSCACEVLTYGQGEDAMLRPLDVQAGLTGTRFTLQSPWGRTPVETQLIGEFNIYNLLAAAGICAGEGVEPVEFARTIADFPGVPGRLERVDDGRVGFTVVVDYAHTADSLKAVIGTLRGLKPGHLITLIGCGGDRDRSKRPVMARVATEASEFTVFTSDNPRTEDPERILDEVEAGAAPGRRYARLVDRKAAIRTAIDAAKPGDVVLIAGKGHEDYQILGHTKVPFDDRVEARRALGLL